MKDGWEIKKLGEICSFVRGPFGGSLKKNIFKPSGYAVYEQQHAIYDQFEDVRYFIDEDKFNEMKRFQLTSGDLIMSCSGTMGKIAIVPQNIREGVINQALLILRPSKSVSTIFLKLWMQSEIFQESLKEYSGGAAIQNVASVAVLKQIEIPLPPLPEQQRIVSILDEAFAVIARAKANAEQNLRNAKELFESYLQGVFERKGEGWEEKTLGEVCLFKGGGTPSTKVKKYWEGKIPWVSPKDMKSKIISDSQDHLTIEAINNSSASLIPKGSILIVVRSGILVRIVPIGITIEDVSINQDLKALCPKKNIDTNYLYYFLEGNMRLLLSKVTRGATVHRISTDSLRDLKIGVPNIKEQQAIVQKLDAISAETKKLETIYQQKINDLEEMKKSILQKAFSGEL